jgi:hypothetical protein
MVDRLRYASLATYGIVLLCLFLPFVHVQCAGERVATITGIQLVTGATVGQPDAPSRDRSIGIRPFGEPTVREHRGDSKAVPAEPMAIALAGSAVAGLLLSLVKSKSGNIGAIAAGILGLGFLLLLKIKIDNEVLKEAEGAIQIQYASGFWLALLVLIAAVGLNAYLGYLAGKPFTGGAGFGPPTIDGDQHLLKSN